MLLLLNVVVSLYILLLVPPKVSWSCAASSECSYFLCAGALNMNKVASRLRETPIFDHAIFCAQARCFRHVVFKTLAPVVENPSFFRC